MTTVFTVLGVLHWAGLAAIVIGYALSLGNGVIQPAMVWGARVQLLLGLSLVAVAEMTHNPPSHAWVGIKLVVALAVVALCEIARGRAKRGANKPLLMHIAAGLVVVNVLVATSV